MPRKAPIVLALMILVLTTASAAQGVERTIGRAGSGSGQSRVALVIGNGNYAKSPLKNPANDARAMSATLRELGFEVTTGRDLNQKQMQKLIVKFGRALKKCDVGLFYYAGHGIQVEGENYLIPLEADLEDVETVPVEAVGLRYVLARMAAAKNRLNVVILDACRDNPFERSFRSSGGSLGLASVLAPTGTLIAYATSPGQTAADGTGRNGVYTEALIRSIKTPGLPLEKVFRKTRERVVKATDKRQVPWESSSVMGDDFYFVASTGHPPPRPRAKTSGPVITDEQEVFGEVEVSANVRGARFELAGQEFVTKSGRVMTIGQVPVGTHRIRATKKGYRPWSHSLEVTENRTARLTIRMVRVSASKDLDGENPRVVAGGIFVGPDGSESEDIRDLFLSTFPAHGKKLRLASYRPEEGDADLVVSGRATVSAKESAGEGAAVASLVGSIFGGKLGRAIQQDAGNGVRKISARVTIRARDINRDSTLVVLKEAAHECPLDADEKDESFKAIRSAMVAAAEELAAKLGGESNPLSFLGSSSSSSDDAPDDAVDR